MKKLSLAGFEVDVPLDWQLLPQSTDTLAGAAGALQITTAMHATDTRPTVMDLRDIIQAMAEANALPAPVEVTYFDTEPLRAAVSSFVRGDDFIRVYSVSDGTSFALATYVCRVGSEQVEAEAVELIVRSLRFSAPRVAS